MKSIKFLVTLVALLNLSTAALSQADTRNYAKEAEQLWQAGAYSEAADAYKKASEKVDPRNDKARLKKAYFAYMSATCYKLLHNFAAAEQQYEKAILLRYYEVEPKVYFYLAEMEMAQCKHDEAKENYQKYDKLAPGDPITKVRIESCEKYKEATEKNQTKHQMSNVTKLNTAEFDYAPVMGPRGTEMYFSSSRAGSSGELVDPITGQNYMDIWVTTIDKKNNWGQPQPIASPVNTGDNEGTLCFDSRGKTMWFTRCPSEDKMRLGCDIYMSEKKGDNFDEPVLLKLKDHDSTNVGHPCISPDGKSLIFASDMAGGYGGLDLWISVYDKRSESWSLPINLGPTVNTPGNDCFPTWGPNNELFYASDGMVGLGGLDIYRATRVGEENKWEKPTNLGFPMNSCRDDYHIIYTESGKVERGFISSNRNGSKGENSQDIWDFYLPPVLVDVDILVTDQDKGYPIVGAKVIIVGSDGSNYVMNTDANGRISLNVKPDGTTRYIDPGTTWTIEVEGVLQKYLGTSDAFSAVTENNLRIVRDLKVLNIEKPIRLPEVRYDLGKADLQVNDSVNSKDSLNYLYDLMIEHPNLIVELGSHTDSRGSGPANQTLSQARAQSCINYLVLERGLPAERFVPKGYGENVPFTLVEVSATGDTTKTLLTEAYINKYKAEKNKFEMLHQYNRRTECKILSFDYVPATTGTGTNGTGTAPGGN
ncbi:MAG: OmpA family protein [Crocinitomicaceae bacterium]|nr:OmpA family protein [Crocinitomicaceae bacterium]